MLYRIFKRICKMGERNHSTVHNNGFNMAHTADDKKADNYTPWFYFGGLTVFSFSEVRTHFSLAERNLPNRMLGDVFCRLYTLSEAWSGVNWAHLMAAQGTLGTDFYDRSILSPKHRAYYRSGRPVIKIGPKGALGRHEIRLIHSAPSLGQSIPAWQMWIPSV